MVNQSYIVKPKPLEDRGSHGNTDDEFEEYSEEELLSEEEEEEESNENLCTRPKKEGSCAILSKVEGSCAEEPIEGSSPDEESSAEVSCGDESDDEDSCPEEPNEEDPDEEPETQRTTLEEASDEDPSDVSFEDIMEEEFYEESDEEPNGEEPLRGSMDQPPLIINSDGVPNASDHIFSESTDRSADAIVSKQSDDPSASRKKRRSGWDVRAEAPMPVNENGDLDKKRKTRWSDDTKAEAPIVANDNTDLNKRRKTRWSSDETHLNNEKKDEPKSRSKNHYKFCKKLYIPSKEYPNYNFVGLILGPNGNTLKKMEEETGSIIILRGKGSSFKAQQSNADDRDDLHVLIQSDSQACLDAAVKMVEKLLVPVDDQHNYHKAAQLRELAELRGTLNKGSLWGMKACDICGQSSHPTSDCPLIATASKDNANFHTGSGSLFSSFKSPLAPCPVPLDEPKKENDPATLYVCFLPESVSADKLKELFVPYGSICGVTVIKDKSTGLSKGYGFVKYASAGDAARAIEKMNGHMIDGRKLAVRIAGPSSSLNANLPIYPGSVSIPTPTLISNLPNYLGLSRPSTSNANLPKIEACDICGQSGHPTSDCPLIATASKDNANFHTGSGSLFSSFKSPLPPFPAPLDEPKKENDPVSLFVGQLPQSVSTEKLKELFLPYGSICKASVLKDKSTGRSKGCGFVKYASAGDAAIAIEKMNGYMIDGRKLAIGIAGSSSSSNANLPIYPGSVSILPTPSLISNLPNYLGLLSHPSTSNANLPNYRGLLPFPPSNANPPNHPKLAAIPQAIPKTNSWPGPPGSLIPESSVSFPKSSYDSATYTETVPLQPSTFLGSTFQTTSLLKNGCMMDAKKPNVAVAGTPPPSSTANLPKYPGFAAVPREIPVPTRWPSPPGSMLPESGTHFPKSNYISSISSSQFPGVTATSNELASFPGYLKSFDSPRLLDLSMPSTDLSSPYFIGNFSGNQMNPTRR